MARVEKAGAPQLRGGRRTRRLRVLAVVLVALSTVGGGAVAASGADKKPEANVNVPTAKEQAAVERQMREMAAAAKVQEDRRVQERRTPEARAARERSRTAFRGLGGADARALAKQTFPMVYATAAWKAPGPAEGERIERYLGDHGAILENDRKGKHVLQSMFPLRAPGDDGKLAPTDATLVNTAQGFEPETGLVDLTVADDVTAGVAFPAAGVTLRPVGVDAATAAAGEKLGKSVTWTDIATDTDYSVTTTPDGVETFHVLRSASSPERLAFSVDRPEGTDIVPSQEGNGATLKRGDQVIATITPPVARGADGEAFPVGLEITPEGVALTVDHQDADIAYPLLVDPAVIIDQRYWTHNAGLNFKGWGYTQVGAAFHYGVVSGYGRGLQTWNIANNFYPQFSWGQWYFQAPGQTRIDRGEFGNIYWRNGGGGPRMCFQQGFQDANWNWLGSVFDAGVQDPTDYPGPWTHCGFDFDDQYRVHQVSPAPAPAGNLFVARFFAGAASQSDATALLRINGAAVVITDSDNPVAHAPGGMPGPAWGSHPQTQSVSIVATDAGLGMSDVRLDGPGGVHGTASTGCNANVIADAVNQTAISCPYQASTTFNLQHREGEQIYAVRGTDAVGLTTVPHYTTVRTDWSGPATPTISGAITQNPNLAKGDPIPLTFSAHDAYSGVARIRVAVDGGQQHDLPGNACGNAYGGCNQSLSNAAHTFSTTSLSPGVHEITAQAFDAVGHASTVARVSFTIIDPTAPTLTVSGGVRSSPLVPNTRLAVTASDAETSVASVKWWVAPAASTAETPDGVVPTGAPRSQQFCSSGCPTLSLNSGLPTAAPGRYQVTVEARNQQGSATREQWIIHVAAVRPGNRAKLGLEEWFDLDETDVGGEQTVFVNGETGNAVWQSVPTVNRGRGLSAPVTLTYNSQERGGVIGGTLGRVPVLGSSTEDNAAFTDDMTGLAHDDAGQGFSLSVGGATRVNEPLGGVATAAAIELMIGPNAPWPHYAYANTFLGYLRPGSTLPGDSLVRVTLTDADGTRHTFTRVTGQTAWQSPAGVNMRLRYIGPRGTNATFLPNVGTAAQLADPANFNWELLRPDGVRHQFDARGYLRRTIDRNGNTTTYVYAAIDAATGDACDPTTSIGRVTSPALRACYLRLVEVRQPTWAPQDDPATAGDERARRVTLDYVIDGEPISNLVSGRFGLRATTLVESTSTLAPPARVRQITDAAGRAYRLAYNAAGQLTEFREAHESDSVAGRVTRFSYGEPAGATADPCGSGVAPASPGPGDVNQLTRIVPVVDGQEQASTCLAYEPRAGGATPAPRRVARIVKRGGAQKVMRYSAAGAVPTRFTVHEQTTGTRHLTRESDLDTSGRPTVVRERTSEIDGTGNATPVPGQGASETRLTWSADHKVASVTEENGALDRVTTMTYAPVTGVLEDRTVTVGTAGQPGFQRRAWDFGYDAPGGTIPDDALVADLDKIELPGGRRWDFTIDEQTGNVTKTKTPAGATMDTTYGTGGVVTGEQDEMGRWTTYTDFDSGGLPGVVTEPGNRVSAYRYDAQGNTTHIVDPRGQIADVAGNGDAPYKTRLTYDAFDRLVSERIPQLSAPESPDDNPVYITRTRRFDRNGNPTQIVDGEDETTTITYDADGARTAIDRPGSSGREVTRFVHDGAQRVIVKAEPKATWSASAAANLAMSVPLMCESPDVVGARSHVTAYCLDHRGLPQAEVQFSNRAGDVVNRVRSYAHDAFGNVTGVADPNRNSRTHNAGMPTEYQEPVAVPEALANAADPVDRRYGFEYDLLDRRVRAVEHAKGASTANDREQRWTYNDTDDLASVTVENGAEDRLTAFTYDDLGRRLTETDPLGRITCWRRQADGLVTSITTPRGMAGKSAASCKDEPLADGALFTTTMTYDAAGFLETRTVPWDGEEYGGRPDKPWQVTYTRDEVGDPLQIQDARGFTFDNEFFDTGELRETERPSWWALDWGAGQRNPQPGGRYGGGEVADTEVVPGGPALVERGGRSANALQSGLLPSKPDSLGKGDLGTVDRAPAPYWLPPAGTTRFEYDGEQRLTRIVDPLLTAGDQRPDRAIEYDPAGRVALKKWMVGSGSEYIEHDFSYDANGNLTEVGEDWKPAAGSASAIDVDTQFTYDGYDRRITQTTEGADPSDPDSPGLSEVTEFAYDVNDNLRRWQTPRGEDHAFTYTHDSLDQLVTETNPIALTRTYGYNRVGERTTEVRPHDVANEVASLYTTTSTYDLAGQLKTVARKVDVPDEAAHDLLWEYEHDADGNLQRTETPGPSVEQGGKRQVTEVIHDARGLPWKTTIKGAGDQAGVKRTTVTEYDANGNLRRSVRPAGLDGDGMPESQDDGTNLSANMTAASEEAHAYAYDENDLLVFERVPWRGGEDPAERRWVREDERGFVTEILRPRTVGESPAGRTLFTYDAAGWITSSTDDLQGLRPNEETKVTYAYDEQGQQTRWSAKPRSDETAHRNIRWTYWPNGEVKRRTGSVDQSPDDEGGTTSLRYDYFYNRNRSLVRVVDQDVDRDTSGNQSRITLYGRDAAERQTEVDETDATGDSQRNDVEFLYDQFTGDLERRRTDGHFEPVVDESGDPVTNPDGSPQKQYTGDVRRSTSFVHDSLGREISMRVDPTAANGDDTGDDEPDRTTSTRWFDGGQLRLRVRPTGTRETWEWNVRGEKTERSRDPETGDTETQEYTYDANGNRTLDERGARTAPDDPADAYLRYNARDQLVYWRRPSDRGRESRRGWVTRYTLDETGAVTRKREISPDDADAQDDPDTPDIDESVTVDTRMSLPGGRIDTIRVNDRDQVAGTTVRLRQSYRYDDTGNVQRVYHDASSTDPGQPVTLGEPPRESKTPQQCRDDDAANLPAGRKRVTRYCFDEFNRQIFASGYGEDDPTAVYYDGLDRRDRTKVMTTGGADRDLTYLGTTELLARESPRGTPVGETRFAYDYTSTGERIGQQSSRGGNRFYAYDKDANGSVIGLEQDGDGAEAAGTIRSSDRYQYDPYGSLDGDENESGQTDQTRFGLSTQASDNPFRFQGFYADSGTDSYDMHARGYRPGGAQFLSRDLYASAAGDFALTADLLTQNRYAFAGGNPVTNVEFDGHSYGIDGGGSVGGPRDTKSRPTTTDRAVPASQQTHSVLPQNHPKLTAAREAVAVALDEQARGVPMPNEVGSAKPVKIENPNRSLLDQIKGSRKWVSPQQLACGCDDPDHRPGGFELAMEMFQHFGPIAGVKAPSTRLAPARNGRVGLPAHEAGMSDASGHLMAKHVGKSDGYLRSRLVNEPKKKMVSTFTNRGTAESATSAYLMAKDSEIQLWLAKSKPGSTKPFGPHAFENEIGTVLRRDAAVAQPAKELELVLRRDTSDLGYHIYTGMLK